MARVSRRSIARIGLFLAALGATLAAQARLPAPPSADLRGDPLVPRPQAARVAALGFESLLADYFWLRAVQLVGGEAENPDRHARAIGRYAEAVTTLDPWVDHPYRFAALWMSDDPEGVHQANRLLERGIAYHPRDWRNRFYLSFNYLFHLGDTEAAARELEPALGLEGAPLYLGRLLAKLRSAGGDLDAAAAYLQALLDQDQEHDQWRRAAYEEALVEIETERRARQLDEARARFAAQNGFDIGRVEDLAWGPHAVLWTLPAEPNGAGWAIDAASGRIVSTHYHRRYQVHFQNPAQKLKAPAADRGEQRGEQG